MIYLIVFQSVTYAQRGANLLQNAGFFSTIVRAQASLGGGSCSYGLKFRAESPARAVDILNRNAVPYKKIYTANAIGGFIEIK